MAEPLLQTTVVGSYPQPDWLVNREMLSKVVPRTRLKEIWRVPEAYLQQAQDDATLLAIRDMEQAGIDIITDGEMRRESYSTISPRRWRHRQENRLRDGALRQNGGAARGRQDPARARRAARHAVPCAPTPDRPAKITLPGPFTMGQQVKDGF